MCGMDFTSPYSLRQLCHLRLPVSWSDLLSFCAQILSVISSVGYDLKSTDLKSLFEIVFVIVIEI